MPRLDVHVSVDESWRDVVRVKFTFGGTLFQRDDDSVVDRYGSILHVSGVHVD